MNQKIYQMFQQSELDAVLMYRALADKAKSNAEKELLLRLGAIEGKHAAVLRGITGSGERKPTDALAKPIALLERFAGRGLTYRLIALGEKAAYYLYQPLAKEHPELQTNAKEETEHGKTLQWLAKAIR